MNRGLNRFAGPTQPGGFPWAQSIHGAGTLASRPPATPANAGFFYLATDTAGGTLYRSSGTAWVACAPGVTTVNGVSSVTVTTTGGLTVSGGTSQTITNSGTFALAFSGAITPAGVTSSAGGSFTVTNAGTTDVPTVLGYAHRTSGTPAAGFGADLVCNLDDSTNVAQVASDWATTWVDATSASRKARTVGRVYDLLSREWIRGETNGSAAKIGFLGTAAALQQTGDAGTALVTFGLMSGTPTFALANATGTLTLAKGGTGADLSATGPGVLRQLTVGATPTAGRAYDLIIIRDQKSSGTHGGGFTSGAWQTRNLTNLVTDTGSNCSVASNQFTLTAGTYEIDASAPALAVNGHQAKLYNVSDSADVILGTSEVTSSSDVTQSRSIVQGEFTIAASKTFEIRHQCGTTAATTGFGRACSFGTEVYTIIKLKRAMI